MKKIISILAGAALLILISCGNETGLDQDLLNGVIGGGEWRYQFAKANFDFNGSVDIEMYGQMEQETNPCVINSIEGYISVTLPTETGTYTLPLPIQSETLRFHQPGVGQMLFVANSGFVEVFTVEGRRVAGYIQASFDEDNTVEGTFIFDTCN